MNSFLARLSRRQLIQASARVPVMFEGVIQMSCRSVLAQLRQQGAESGLRVSHETEVNLGAASELLASYVNLNDGSVFRKELLIGKVRSDHQQEVASHHRVIPGGVPKQAGHAYIKRIVVFDEFFPAQSVHDRSLQLPRDRNQLRVSSGAACSAQDRHFLGPIQNFSERLYLALRRTNIRAWIRKMEAWPLFNRFTKRYVSRQGNHRDTALCERGLYANLQNPWHLRSLRDELTIVAALPKEMVRVGFLEIAASDFVAWYLRSNR